jgi:hypothetical protein
MARRTAAELQAFRQRRRKRIKNTFQNKIVPFAKKAWQEYGPGLMQKAQEAGMKYYLGSGLVLPGAGLYRKHKRSALGSFHKRGRLITNPTRADYAMVKGRNAARQVRRRAKKGVGPRRSARLATKAARASVYGGPAAARRAMYGRVTDYA